MLSVMCEGQREGHARLQFALPEVEMEKRRKGTSITLEAISRTFWSTLITF